VGLSFEINEEDIRLHHSALNHGVETELRFKGTKQLAPQNRKERFVHSQDKVIEVVKKYNPLTNAYIGNNERWIGGSHIVEVKTINGQYTDYESFDHATNGKNWALRLAEQDRADLKKFNINLPLSDTGRGIHGGIFLDKPIPIDCPDEEGSISLLEARDYIMRIKTWVKTRKNEGAKSDPVPHHLACMEKLCGSYSHSAGVPTFWLDKPKKTKTSDWLKWVQTMPKENVSHDATQNQVGHNVALETIPSNCRFIKWILANNLPRSEDIVRYHYVSPSVAAYTRNLKDREAVRRAWERLQDSTGSYVGSLACWDKIPSKFNCCALRRWGKVVGLTKYCVACIEELI
jgi:hypothetical protein